MGLDRMFSSVINSLERQVTRQVTGKISDKVSNLFSKKDNEQAEKVPVSSDEDKKKNLVIASAYVGFAASYADDELDPSEASAIEQFKAQLASNGENDLAIEIMKIKGEKPSFEDAMKHVDKFPNDMLSFFGGLIDDVIKADKEVGTEEQVFFEKWQQYKTSRVKK